MLTSVCLIPHGMQIIPGLEDHQPAAFHSLHDAMLRAGRDLRADQPDLLLLLTPHGHCIESAYLVYLHERFQGLHYRLTESNVFGEVGERFLWPGDRPAAEALLAALVAAGLPAEGLVQGSPGYPLTLAWGETVPLTYLAGSPGPRVIILALPRTRRDPRAVGGQLERLGHTLLSFARAREERVALAVSADLSHVHDSSGPYGAHESAQPFDRLAQEWAREPTRERLERMLELQPTALACGLAGMCALQPLLAEAEMSLTWLAYAAPTYFGMMVARWECAS